jgi:hypothetical protein
MIAEKSCLIVQRKTIRLGVAWALEAKRMKEKDNK